MISVYCLGLYIYIYVYIYIYFPVYICINFAVMHRIKGKVGSLAFCECSAICRRTSKKSAFSARGCADPVRCLSSIDSWCWSDGGFNQMIWGFYVEKNHQLKPPSDNDMGSLQSLQSLNFRFQASGTASCSPAARCISQTPDDFPAPLHASLNRVFVTQNLWHKQKGTLHFRFKL